MRGSCRMLRQGLGSRTRVCLALRTWGTGSWASKARLGSYLLTSGWSLEEHQAVPSLGFKTVFRVDMRGPLLSTILTGQPLGWVALGSGSEAVR